jgi:hypothetical protein
MGESKGCIRLHRCRLLGPRSHSRSDLNVAVRFAQHYRPFAYPLRYRYFEPWSQSVMFVVSKMSFSCHRPNSDDIRLATCGHQVTHTRVQIRWPYIRCRNPPVGPELAHRRSSRFPLSHAQPPQSKRPQSSNTKSWLLLKRHMLQ